MMENEVTRQIIGAAIEVHRAMGPGLLEVVYEECLTMELRMRGLTVERQRSVPLSYKGHRIGSDLKVDLLVNESVIVELKAVESVLPVHGAQLLSYLRLTGCHIGLLINFNVPTLREGIKRIVNDFKDSASPRLCVEEKPG